MRNYSTHAVGIASGLLLLTPPAFAQTAPAAEVQADGLGDIIVTAQRREQNLQDIPLAVSALSGEVAQTMGVKSTTDLSMATPGLTIAPSVNAISPFIRGVGNTNTAPGDEAATAIYVDGVYIATLTSAMFSLSNIERVEVLRGPQGTLFGRNAVGGVIQVITRKPTETPTMDVSLGYGNYDTLEASLYAASGIAEGLAADISLYGMRQDDGWGKNLTTGNDVFKGREFSARTRWVWDAGDATEISFGADYNRARPVVTQAYNQVPGTVPSPSRQASAGFYNVQLSRDVKALNKQWGANLQIRHDMDWARLVSITSYRNVDADFGFDQDGQPINFTYFTFNRGAKTFTQEFQLQAPTDSAIDWIVGTYYFQDRAFSSPTRLQGTAFGGATIDRYGVQKAKSYAAFGQATAEVFTDTNLTVGLRYTIDKREIDGRTVVTTPLGVTLPPSGIVNDSETFKKPTWRISIDHKFGNNTLAYLSYNRGFKSGVYNVTNVAQAPVKPAIVDAFEFGLKTEPADRVKLNIAAFYNDYKDIQYNRSVPGGQLLYNAGAGNIYGLEAELSLRASSAFSINSGISVQKSEYTDFVDAPAYDPLPTGGNVEGLRDAKGNKMLLTPDFTAFVSARYVIETNAGNFVLAGAYSYNDGFSFEPQNRLKQPAYHMVNGSLEWKSSDETWGLRIWGRNLTNEKYFSTMQPNVQGDQAVPAAPRTYGVTATAHF